MAPKAGKASEWVYDELLCFVGSPLFQVPVMTFIEANCLIFDTTRDDCREYRELHGSYSALVTVLLDAFREDTTLTHDQIIKAMIEMSKKVELRQIFKGLFEQILATESLKIFVRIMTQKNIELQQQALKLIMKQLGRSPPAAQNNRSAAAAASHGKPRAQQAPAAAAPGGGGGKSAAAAAGSSSSSTASGAAKKSEPAAAPTAPTAPDARLRAAAPEPTAQPPHEATAEVPAAAAAAGNDQEDRILENAISSAEAQKDGEGLMQSLTAADVERTVALTQAQASLLESEKRKEDERLVQAVQSLVVGDDAGSAAQAEPVAGAASSATEARLAVKHLTNLPPLQVPSAGSSAFGLGLFSSFDPFQQSSSSEATSGTPRPSAETAAAMSAEERQKRQDFMRRQREKLLELKKHEREKQLESYERSQPVSRPKSSRAARAAIATQQQPAAAQPSGGEEDEKRVAMRKAIANRLKEEMLAGR